MEIRRIRTGGRDRVALRPDSSECVSGRNHLDLSWASRRVVIGALALTTTFYVAAFTMGIYERRRDGSAVSAALAGLAGWFVLLLPSGQILLTSVSEAQSLGRSGGMSA